MNPGDTFEILSAASITGEFSDILLGEGFEAGLTINLTYHADRIILDVSALSGDANLDGVVESLDLNVIEQHLGGVGGFREGDLDGDGDIDGFDFAVWQANFGLSLNGTGQVTVTNASVPEPVSGIALFFIFGCVRVRNSG